MKRGISLVILLIIIIIIAILATTVALSSGGLIKDSRLNNFATNMSKLQDAATSYYITRGKLPIIENTTVLTKADLLSQVGTEKAVPLSTEIQKNGDDNSEFYFVNVEKLNIESIPYGISNTSLNLVINNEGTRVYFLDGYDIDGVLYFGITKEIK